MRHFLVLGLQCLVAVHMVADTTDAADAVDSGAVSDAVPRAYAAATAMIDAVAASDERSGRFPECRAKFFEPSGQLVACALLLHGLNTDPCAMDTLARELADNGVLVYRAALEGHGCPPDIMRNASRQRWLTDARAAWRVVENVSTYLDVPALAAGFSLGGLVISDLSRHDPTFQPAGFVLVAPASRVRLHANLPRLTAWLGISLPSAAPQAYRSVPTLPAEAYRALYDTIDSVSAQPIPTDSPSLIIVDPDDFLVDTQALLQDAGTLQDCRIVVVHATGTGAAAGHHLLLDPASAGTSAWDTIRFELAEFVERIASEQSATPQSHRP